MLTHVGTNNYAYICAPSPQCFLKPADFKHNWKPTGQSESSCCLKLAGLDFLTVVTSGPARQTAHPPGPQR